MFKSSFKQIDDEPSISSKWSEEGESKWEKPSEEEGIAVAMSSPERVKNQEQPSPSSSNRSRREEVYSIVNKDEPLSHIDDEERRRILREIEVRELCKSFLDLYQNSVILYPSLYFR